MKLNKCIVVDFEATCWAEEEKVSREHSEIIEIGITEVIMTNQFHMAPSLGKSSSILCIPQRGTHAPTAMPDLSKFCTELTGITNEQLQKEGKTFAWAAYDVNRRYGKWTWCSWGEYDREILNQTCHMNGTMYPLSRNHINLKLVFSLITGHPVCGILEALDYLQMKPIGRHHSGVDDSLNEARILVKMATITRNLFAAMHSTLENKEETKDDSAK